MAPACAQKQQNKKNELKLPFCWDLLMAPLVFRSNKTLKKEKKEGVQAPLMLRLRDGVHLHQK